MTGRPDKRSSVLHGARTVFARDGYARASMDAVALEAGVSTRTIYKHFGGKADLFADVIVASATEVADRFRNSVSGLDGSDDLRGRLVALGLAFAALRTEAPEHFDLLARSHADRDHHPSELVDAWREAGPLAVRREMAARLRALPGLALTDAERAAAHLSALVVAERGERELEAAVRDGVEVFLQGYASDPRGTAVVADLPTRRGRS